MNIFGIRRIITGIIAAMALSGLLYGGCQVKSCIRAKERAKVAETKLEVKDEVQKRQEEVDRMYDDDLLKYWGSNRVHGKDGDSPPAPTGKTRPGKPGAEQK